MRNWLFAKGHGTENDFVLIQDRHDMIEITDDDVRLLCNRHAGIGADGVLRIVKAAHMEQWDGDPDIYFMDYRNSDGSIAEICGNGLRVMARYLVDQGLVLKDEFNIATRAGVRKIIMRRDGLITVEMGKVKLLDDRVVVHLQNQNWSATAVDVGNPHTAVMLNCPDEVSRLDLHSAPKWYPPEVFPHGTNVEFIAEKEPGTIVTRVYERGVGETRSCGSGVVAAAMVYANGANGQYQVEVLGGKLTVELRDGCATLTGPAVIIGVGKIHLEDRD